MKFKNKMGETVVIGCDANYSKGAVCYEQLKHVATENGIDYTNEGIASVILKMLTKKATEKREYLDEQNRQSLIERFGNKCAECQLTSESLKLTI